MIDKEKEEELNKILDFLKRLEIGSPDLKNFGKAWLHDDPAKLSDFLEGLHQKTKDVFLTKNPQTIQEYINELLDALGRGSVEVAVVIFITPHL